MSNLGWIKIHRELMNKPIWLNSTPEQKIVLITLLMMVNHSPNQWEWKGQQFKVESGQKITSLENIVKECGKGITIQNVRSSLIRFEKLGFLTNESTKTGRLITIVKWHVYQDEEIIPNKDINKDPTKTQQRPNKDPTTNNNVNNVNNENNVRSINNKKIKKDIYIPLKKCFQDCVLLTVEEYDKLVEQFGNRDTDDRISRLNDYIMSKGVKYKSHYHTILNWARKEPPKPKRNIVL